MTLGTGHPGGRGGTGRRAARGRLVRHDGETIRWALQARRREPARAVPPNPRLPGDPTDHAQRHHRRRSPARGRADRRRPREMGQADPPFGARRVRRRARRAAADGAPGSRARRQVARAGAAAAARRRATGVARAAAAARLVLAARPGRPAHREHGRFGRRARRRDHQDRARRRASRPASGMWLHFLRNVAELHVWWAGTNALEEYEDALLDAFAAGITDADRAAAAKGTAGAAASILPWAVLRSPSGTRKDTGITNPLLPEAKAPEPPPVTRIVQFPAGEADGARDEAKRARRPAPGRGTGRVASAAAYAAKGSPRKPPPEPVLVSAEGLERLQAELAELLAAAPGRDQADRDRPGARRPQGERGVPRRARGAGVPGGPDQGARGQAQGRPGGRPRPSAAPGWSSGRT